MHTLDTIIARCPHRVGACHQAKANNIHQALQAGVPFTQLGGKHVRSCQG